MAAPVNLISFPFRIDANGDVVKHEQNSDIQLGEEIAVLISTVVGERVLAPGFGITDFVFSTIDEAELNLKVRAYEIPVRIKDIETVYPKDGVQNVTVEFDTNLGRGRA